MASAQLVETSFATTVLLSTPVTQMIIFNQGIIIIIIVIIIIIIIIIIMVISIYMVPKSKYYKVCYIDQRYRNRYIY